MSAGTGISYDNTTGIITNDAPDQTVSLTGGTDISVTGTYPDFTIDFDGNTSYLPLSGGTMTGSITSFGTTHDTEVSGDFFGVQLSADHTQGTMINFDGLDTYSGSSHMKVIPTGLTFPDATTQTTAYTGGAGVSSIIAGTGISVDAATGDVTITNEAPDQTVSLTDGTGISVTGTYPDFTITNSAPDQTVSLTNGTGISVTGTYPDFTIESTITQYTDSDARKSISAGTGISYDNATGIITNDAPDQTVSLTEGTDITITGTYPDFTIAYSGTPSGGTVTSIGITTTATSLSITSSPITTSGDIGINFSGTGSEYVTGDGGLKTFPTTIDQALNLVTEVYNETGSTLTKGTVVYINGGHGNLPTITKAQANSDANSAQTYGIVQSNISDQDNGYVVVSGRLIDIDTQVYSAGTQLYLSPTTAGAWTSTKPSAPSHLVYVGIVVRSHPTQGVVTVKIQNGYELDEIHDVSITSVANNNILQYNSSTKLWTNVAGTTKNISEDTNLYYTDTRARSSVSSTATGLTYTSGTGVFSLTAGYSIPTTSSQTNWDTAYTNRITSLTTTGSSGSATLATNTLNVPTYTLAGLGGIKLTDLSSTATGLTYTNTTGVFSLTSGYSIPTTAKQTNWDTAYSNYLQWDGSATNLVAATGRTSLGATTVGGNMFTLTNPTAITFPRFNADNTVSALDAATFRTAIGAGTSSTTGTVTSVAALTLGTTGTDVSSTVATGTTTPVITLNIPTASATNRGALSSSDFTNFNTAYTNRILSLTTSGSSGAATLATNTLNIPNYTLAGLGGQASSASLTSLAGLTYVSSSFVKMTAANTFALDTATYLTANQNITLSGDVTGSGTTSITTTLATVPITKGGTGQTTANAAVNALLPSQTSNSGKYLTTDGSNSSWGTVSTGTTIPSASMQMFAGAITQSASAGVVTTTAPTGWLLCNGDAVSRVTYSALWTALGTTSSPFGQGDGSTTFNLPDTRGRVPVSVGTGSGLTARTLGGTVGTETHTVGSSNITQFSTGNAGSHTHTLSKEVLTYRGTGGDRYDPYPGSVWQGSVGAGLTLSTQADHSHTVGSASPTAISNMQPSIGFNFIIKT